MPKTWYLRPLRLFLLMERVPDRLALSVRNHRRTMILGIGHLVVVRGGLI